MTAQALQERQRIIDGWINLLSGMGVRGRDKTEGTTYQLSEPLPDEVLTDIYMGDGLGARIVNLPAEDMTRRWFTIENDPEQNITNELEQLKAQSYIDEAVRWTRLYGGALVVMGLQDGRPLEEPTGKNIRAIEWLKVYPRTRITLKDEDFVSDPQSRYFEDIELFPVLTYRNDTKKIHRSRCLVFHGIPMPRDPQRPIPHDQGYWGLSALQQTWSRLTNFASMEKGIANTIQEFIISVFKLSNLAEMLAEDQADKAKTRIEIINLSKSVINAVLLGENEEFDRNVASVAGIADVMDRFMAILSGITGIPQTKLFGRSPAGLNATGESDMRNYYDMIASNQNTWLKPAIQPLIGYISQYKKIKEPIIRYRSLEEPTEQETVELRNKQAQTDTAYVAIGTIDAAEVRKMRFEGGYSLEMSVEEEEK